MLNQTGISEIQKAVVLYEMSLDEEVQGGKVEGKVDFV